MIKLRLEEGQEIPFGYGFAWYEFDVRGMVCYPIPINIIASAIRRLYFYFAWGYSSPIELEQRAYELYMQWVDKQRKTKDQMRQEIYEELMEAFEKDCEQSRQKHNHL